MPAAVDAEVGSAAASRKEHVALGHDGGTAAELTTSASAAYTPLHFGTRVNSLLKQCV